MYNDDSSESLNRWVPFSTHPSMYSTSSTNAIDSSIFSSSTLSLEHCTFCVQSDLYRFLKEIGHFRWYFASIAINSSSDIRPVYCNNSKSSSSRVIRRTLLSVSSIERHWSLSLSPPPEHNKHCDCSSELDWRFLRFDAGLPSSSALLSSPRFRPARSWAFLSFERLNLRLQDLCQEPWQRQSTSTSSPNLSSVGKAFASRMLFTFWKKIKYVCRLSSGDPLLFRGHFNASLVDSWQMMHFFQSSDVTVKAPRGQMLFQNFYKVTQFLLL